MATVMKDMFVAELEREGDLTRKVLERVPFDKVDFKPHDKSTTLGRLAVHVATLWTMVPTIVNEDKLVFDKYSPPAVTSTEQLVAIFDENLAAAKTALAATNDEDLMKPWQLFFGEQQVFTGTRAGAFRMIFMSHLIHHRAQLGVYLRLNDVAIPGSYGPSADEPMM